MYRRLQRLISILRELRQLPNVSITMCGDADCRRHYGYFTRFHRRLFIVRNKSWGVALLQIPDTFDEYLKGKEKQALRTNRNHAMKDGFRFDVFSPSAYAKDILEINLSSPLRQGLPMNEGYTDEHKVSIWIRSLPQLFGVFNREGALRAYAKVPFCGEVAIFARLLGHADDLEKGIMYLMISEIVRQCIERKQQCGQPKWLMYDTMVGGAVGIRYFKERLGFKPYRVKWRWSEGCSCS
ncbi:MAG: hypothetical protein N3B12_06015 [Armatimonadetes bacterium]|nr:hypothetical protein [Armatimonadota bacterium]